MPRTSQLRAVATGLAIAALLSASAEAQPGTFKASVVSVMVDVAVTRGGRPVAELTTDAFTLTDNGVRQNVQVTPLFDMPLRVALVLDTSASVRGERLRRLVDASLNLVATLKPSDRISLVTFSQDARMPVPMGPPGPEVRNALAGLNGSGPTAMRDALQLALASEADQRGQSLILVFSDGEDTASWMPAEALLESARRSNSVVHVVRFDVVDEAPPTLLDRLALATSGRTWAANSNGDLESLFTRALDGMRARYLLSYSPQGAHRRGWHTIKVSLNNVRGDVAARPGYFVP